MFTLTKDAAVPLTEQIVRHFAQRIDEGALLPGARLPSVRQLAARLEVSVHTVLAALDRLAGQGYVASRPGAGYYVQRPAGRAAVQAPPPPRAEPATTTAGFTHSALSADATLLQAGSGYLPRHWYEDAIAPATLARSLRESAEAAVVPPVQGLPALREQLAQRLARRQIPASAAHVVTAFGASQALQLAARVLAAPGDVVLVDDPGYFLLHSQLAALGLRVVGVPREAEGPDLDALAALASEYRPRAFFTQTLLHNPTGGSTVPARSHRILNLAEAHDFMLVEDDVYGDLAGDAGVRLAQIDGLRRVVQVGSFSKLLSPSLRVGWLAAPAPLVERLVALKLMDVLSGSTLEEALVAEVLRSGRYHRHVLRLRERLARARGAAIAALQRCGLRFDADAAGGGGVFLWAALPPGVEAPAVVEAAREAGIVIAGGHMFSRRGAGLDRLRLNAAWGTDARLLGFLEERLRQGS
ncbi:aminotransferase-like domain-containing protein [Azohydromonas aeria]|uniref:aminotransferase-like domain-containing protein n=1 Tax=Azohydromonas aeria TaxID=2590212 RepID=UPI0018DF406A|nr:PLP-dependent aminotransferase family protein [Azohydromonas aeria]